MKITSMLVAASLLLTSPATAAQSGFDRAIQRGADAIVSVTGLPVVAYDAVETHVPVVRLHRHAPFLHRVVRGTLGIPRAVAGAGIHAMVSAIAREEGVPVALAHGVVRIESNYRCGVSNHGSHGIMQVKTQTAASVGVHGNLHSCATGLRAGMRYLHQAYLRAHGNMCAAATLYNTGIAGSGRCSAYGRQVLRFARS